MTAAVKRYADIFERTVYEYGDRYLLVADDPESTEPATVNEYERLGNGECLRYDTYETDSGNVIRTPGH